MPYTELIKSFDRIREYMREFYVYGLKSRGEFKKRSARSYDDERRRIESWLGDYMRFQRYADGKRVYISIDSRAARHNPLYAAWKASSFTDGDITLHFILFDILWAPDVEYTLGELTEEIDAYLREIESPRMFDESTVRKKLSEYTAEGIIQAEKRGRVMYYRQAPYDSLPGAEALHFFSEGAPCGVVGSFLLDKLADRRDVFAFKHHYITGALDSGVMCELFTAMGERRAVSLTTARRGKSGVAKKSAVPLRIMISAQSGRQYLMAYFHESNSISSVRLDYITSVRPGQQCSQFDELRARLDGMRPHMWGVSVHSNSARRIEHVEFTVTYGADEGHIHQRLEREKRCGTVERLDEHTSRFTADVYDSSELVPWIRTFICRITSIYLSNEALDSQFRRDIQAMYTMYGLEEGGGAV